MLQELETVAAEERPVPPVVSVIIPVHNGAGRLHALDRALRAQTAAPEVFEVLFVDDGSDDGTPDLIRTFDHAHLIKAPSRGGSYAARNLAITQARGRILAFTDSDCLPQADWIECGLEELEATGADVLAGRVSVDVGEDPSLSALVDAWRFLDQRRWARQGFGATANLWVRRDVFECVGIFQGRLISGGDAEFGHRVTAAGFHVRYAHGVAVGHPPRGEFRELARKAFRMGFGAAQQIRHAEGPLREQGRPWTNWRMYLPRDRVKDVSRLTDQGYYPTRWQRIGMFWVYYLGLRLPYVAGNLTGDVVETARR